MRATNGFEYCVRAAGWLWTRAHISSHGWQVLGHRQTDGSSLLSVDRLVEGIVAFEDEAAAEAFGNALEAVGHQVTDTIAFADTCFTIYMLAVTMLYDFTTIQGIGFTCPHLSWYRTSAWRRQILTSCSGLAPPLQLLWCS